MSIPSQPSDRVVACVVGTRPEAIKMAPVIQALRDAEGLRPVVVATAQHRHMLDQVLSVFRIAPDIDLDLMRPGQTLTQITCRVLETMGDTLERQRPDIVLAQGDTTTVMAAAMACFYRSIPFGHVEAGLRTHTRAEPFPEEFNRCVAGLAATLHFAPTQHAADNLLREDVAPDRVFVTGNTVIDALLHILAHTDAPPRPIPDAKPYVLMTCHRREIFGAPIREVFETVRDYFSRRRDVRLWYPVHPNPNVAGPAREILGDCDNITLSEPLDYIAFAHAMKDCRLLLSDSGGVQEEAPSLGKPVLILRDKTERPEGVEAGVTLLVGPHRDRIRSALDLLLDDPRAYERMASRANPYGDGQAARRIAGILGSAPLP